MGVTGRARRILGAHRRGEVCRGRSPLLRGARGSGEVRCLGFDRRRGGEKGDREEHGHYASPVGSGARATAVLGGGWRGRAGAASTSVASAWLEGSRAGCRRTIWERRARAFRTAPVRGPADKISGFLMGLIAKR